MNRTSLALVLLCSALPSESSHANQSVRSAEGAADGPLAPERALASFQLEPGLRIELVAAEPMIVDPVALCFDERGRMYVAENRGYPVGPGAGQPPVGTIAMLEDTDGDGHFDRRTTFADGLTFPNGLLPWKGGLFVTCAPDLLYLKDTDGDGRADVRRVVFTGFATNKSTQLRVCYPTLGSDHWIYLSSGLSGGKITSPDYPDHPPVDIERSDFRFKPDTDQFEAADGKGQFGMTFDDFGHRFTCMNRVHIQHVVLPSRYLKRNPYLAFSDTMQNVPEAMINDLLKGENRAARIYPISANITTADSHAGTFTAACGVLIYRGTALPEKYRGQAFACDPTGNLVHWDQLIPAGATFTARRAREGIEFLASTDNWFRPVFLANGPDGALYICDMYRKTIEHPEYLPEEIRKKSDFESGKGMGRIYRVVGTRQEAGGGRQETGDRSQGSGVRGQRSVIGNQKIEWAKASVKELCELLGHPNSWQRETAQRLLMERQDHAAVPFLKSSIANRKSQIANSPAARFHALRVLEGLGALDERSSERALADAHSGVRETAIQLVESLLERTGETSRWVPRLVPLAADSDARVRFQAALTLGELNDARTIPPLARIVARDAVDRWTRAAVLSSLGPRADAFLREWIAPGHQMSPHTRVGTLGSESGSDSSASLPSFMVELGRVLGTGQPQNQLAKLVNDVLASNRSSDAPWEIAVVAGIAEGLRSRGVGREGQPVITDLLSPATQAGGKSSGRFGQLIEQAKALAADATQTLPARLSAVRLLAHADFDAAGSTLLALIHPKIPVELQSAAARSLAQMRGLQVAAALLSRDRWQTYTPPLQETVISALLSQPRHLPALLDLIEAGQIPVWSLRPAQRNQLVKHKDESIRARAEALFQQAQSGDRMKVYAECKSVLTLKAQPGNGRAVFKQHCASCHRLDREGIPVGPDLFGIRNQPKEAILLHVIVPDYEIAPGFAGYLVETKDGRTLSGLILSETPTSITLRQAQGIEENILRSNITSVASSNSSLMPAELEKAMTRQDLADLIAYLKGE